MSYTRHYSGSVSGTESVRVSYPASENGGTVTEYVTVTIPIDIDITVDTQPFDHEVASVENHIDFLTASVVATEAAQVAMIAQNARDISDRVTSGFFGLIRSEITQQISEYRSRAQALFLKLNDMKESCLRKTAQMEQDFSRIADRYSVLFRDLDNEIANRVGALDAAAFTVHAIVSNEASRAVLGTLSTTATVTAGENSHLQTLVLTGGIRQRANQLLSDAQGFLASDKRLTRTMQNILRRESNPTAQCRYLPVLYRNTKGPERGGEDLFVPDTGQSPVATTQARRQIEERFRDSSFEWSALSESRRAQIDNYLKSRIERMDPGQGRHQIRVGEMILSLWNASETKVLS